MSNYDSYKQTPPTQSPPDEIDLFDSGTGSSIDSSSLPIEELSPEQQSGMPESPEEQIIEQIPEREIDSEGLYREQREGMPVLTPESSPAIENLSPEQIIGDA